MTRVMEAKLRRPSPGGLQRARLLDSVRGDAAPGVVVVVASPGAGKTTLLAQAAASVVGSVAWCTSGPEDRSHAGFVMHLARSVSRALQTDLGSPRTGAELVDALTRRRGEPERLLLVLDDVHELGGGSAAAELADLVRWRPDHVRIVLGTRRLPDLNTPRLLLSGDLLQLDGDALRFRSWEVEELFRTVYGEPLSPEAAAALTRRTGGWAAGLALFHLATTGKQQADRERAVDELGGRSRLLRSYLTRTVLEELDQERRGFLLRTSTLGTLTGPLCDALLGGQGSAAVLAELAARQFFIAPDEDGSTYRYHQVLQTLLEGLLVEELGRSAAARIYARSGELLEDAGLYDDAIRAYTLAEDDGSVARLVRGSGAVHPPGGPASEADDAWLALAQARHLVRDGSVAASVEAFRHAETLLDDPEFRATCRAERATVSAWLPGGGWRTAKAGRAAGPRASVAELLRGATVQVAGHGSDEVTGAAIGEEPPELRLVAGVRDLLAGDLHAARRTLERAVPTTAAEGLARDLATVVLEVVEGSATDAASRLEDVVLTADLKDQPWFARVGRGMQGALLLRRTGESWRLESCGSLVEECRRLGDDWGAMLLRASVGAALLTRHDARSAEWLHEARDAAQALGAPVLQAWCSTLQSLGAELTGAPAAKVATQWDTARSEAVGCGLGTLAEQVVRRRITLASPPARGGRPGRPVRVSCLGAFGIEVDGRPITLSGLRPLPRALLLFLALRHGQNVHREVLIDWLWPDTAVEAAAHRLHVAASTLRRCLDEAGLGQVALQQQYGAYRLVLGDAVLDVTEFEESLREAAAREARGDLSAALDHQVRALDLYQGDLLSDLGPVDWVAADRDRLRMAAAASALSAGHLCLRLRRAADALSFARRATELDPLRDSAWALLEEVQTLAGDFGSAAATRQAHDAALAELALPGVRRPQH